MKSFLTCSFPLFLIPLLLLHTTATAQFTDEESEFYMQKGIIPFLAQQQDGDYSQGIYLVPHDLTVETGKVMTIMPGSTILFKKDTKIIVKGKLVLKGSTDQRIILRKLDNDMYLNPFSPEMEMPWDGIYIQENGELEASYTNIGGSKYGFSASRKAAIFLLDSVLFIDNKYQNATVGSEILPFENNKLYFYNLAQNKKEPVPMVYIDTVKMPQYIPPPAQPQSVQMIESKPKASKRVIHFRVVSGAVALAGAIMGGGSYYVNDTYYKKYDKYRSPGIDDPEKVGKYETYAKTGRAGLITGAALAAVGLSCLTLTFLF